MRCSRCKDAYYCSKECQKAHWKVHKTLCKENHESSLSYSAVLSVKDFISIARVCDKLCLLRVDNQPRITIKAVTPRLEALLASKKKPLNPLLFSFNLAGKAKFTTREAYRNYWKEGSAALIADLKSLEAVLLPSACCSSPITCPCCEKRATVAIDMRYLESSVLQCEICNKAVERRRTCRSCAKVDFLPCEAVHCKENQVVHAACLRSWLKVKLGERRIHSELLQKDLFQVISKIWKCKKHCDGKANMMIDDYLYPEVTSFGFSVWIDSFF
jgi:hypothetical protein